MRVTTNHVPRFTLDAHELTPAERERFDWLDWQRIDAGKDSATFIRYKGHTYCLDEFMRTDPGGDLHAAGWQGYAADSISTGVVIRLHIDGESALMGWYVS